MSERTTSTIITRLREQACRAPKMVLFPEGDEPRTHAAIEYLRAEGSCEPLLLFPPANSAAPCNALSEQKDFAAMQLSAENVYRQKLEAKGASAADIQQKTAALSGSPLLLAALLVALGHADAGVAGAVNTTGEVLRAGLQAIGLADHAELVSSMFLMEWQGRVLTFADCAVVPQPDSAQLVQIALASAQNHTRLTGEPANIAMLSFSTAGSAQHAAVAEVQAATARLKRDYPELNVEGELQFDAAFIPEVGRKKFPESTLAGHCNVFVFPNLDAGNLGYKIAERMGGARAIGPILQGFAQPWLDVSRGCEARELADTAVIASLLASN